MRGFKRAEAPWRSTVDVFGVESGELRQARRIEQPDMALAEFEKLPLAKFAQHSIDMDRSKAKGVSEVILSERAVKAAAVDRAYPLQTHCQLEQQMCRPFQGAASPYIGKVLGYNRAVAHERPNDEREQMRRFHRSSRQCLGRGHQQRKVGLSHESFNRAASM